MARENIVVGLDVGTTKIATVIAEITPDAQVNIIGVGTAPSEGLRKGVVVDLDDTIRSISNSVEKAKKMAGCEVESVFVGIAGEHVSSMNSKGVVAVSGGKDEITQQNEVTQQDVDRALKQAEIIPISADRKIIHVIARDFIIDGQNGIKNPVGMSGTRLEVETHIVTCGTTFILNLLKCVDRAGFFVDSLILQPLASSETVLSIDEKELGVVLLDIGGGTTDLAIFHNGSIAATSILGVGGSNIDRDIAYGLSTTFSEAERVKIEHGYAKSSLIPEQELIEVKNVSERKKKQVPARIVGEISEARLEEIFELTKADINKSGFADLVPAGIVLTGGTALIRGSVELAKEVLGLPVRIGYPEKIVGLVEQVHSPIYATGVGLVVYGAKHLSAEKILRPKAKFSFSAIIKAIKNLFKE